MKKILVLIYVILVLILSVLVQSYIYGGTPQIENFDEMSKDFQTIVDFSFEYRNKVAYTGDHITLDIRDDYLLDITGLGEDKRVNLNSAQKAALKNIPARFHNAAIWVKEDAVIFWDDETKHYGLVYSENALSTVWDIRNDWYEGMHYHRINANWYEVGFFGR